MPTIVKNVERFVRAWEAGGHSYRLIDPELKRVQAPEAVTQTEEGVLSAIVQQEAS